MAWQNPVDSHAAFRLFESVLIEIREYFVD